MLEEIVPILKSFRDRVYRLFPSRRDAAMELIDALSSNKTANSVVALSLSPLHRRNYCSITRVLDEYLSKDSAVALQQKQALTDLLASFCPEVRQRPFHLFAVDCTPGPRVFSPTLEDRGYVYAPNTVCGNKPVTLGHKYSIVAYLPEKQDAKTPPGLIPLACTCVNTSQNGGLLFKRPLWLTAAGVRRMELSLSDIFLSYRQRYDIEHFFRFGKTRLLMDKIQTPDVRHEDAWWQLVIIAYAQLYLAHSIAESLPNPWEKHLPSFKTNGTIKQPTIVQ